MTPRLDFGPPPIPPPLLVSRAFPGNNKKHPERDGRGWGREIMRDEYGNPVRDPKFGDARTVVWGGYIKLYRADKYLLRGKFDHPALMDIIEHIAGETFDYPDEDAGKKPDWVDVTDQELERITGKQRRTNEKAIAEGERRGVIAREHPELRYNKGKYRLRLDKLAESIAMPREEKKRRQPKGEASQLAPRDKAALRVTPAKTADERAQQIAQLKAQIEAIAALDRQKGEDRANPSVDIALDFALHSPISGEHKAKHSAENDPRVAAQSPAEVALRQVAPVGPPAQQSAPRSLVQIVAPPNAAQPAPETAGHAPGNDPSPATYCPWGWNCPYIPKHTNTGTPVSECVGGGTGTHSLTGKAPIPEAPGISSLEAIAAVIPVEITQRLASVCDAAVLNAVQVALQDTPLEWFARRIGQRMAKITSWPLLVGLATDAWKAWLETVAKTPAPPPPAAPPEVCPQCGGSGFPNVKACHSGEEAQALFAAGHQSCTCDTGKLWEILKQ